MTILGFVVLLAIVLFMLKIIKASFKAMVIAAIGALVLFIVTQLVPYL